MTLAQDLQGIATDREIYRQVVHSTADSVPTDGGEVITLHRANTLLNQKIAQQSIFNYRGDWVTGTSYNFRDTFKYNNIIYVALMDHTSGIFATDLNDKKINVFQGVTSQNASDGSGFTSVKIGGSVDDNTAAFLCQMTRLTLNRHAFGDSSLLETIDSELGYASFDAQATMDNDDPQNHFVGYQSRTVYKGSGGITNYWHGYDTAMVHSGTGQIAFAASLRIREIAGDGPITHSYGIYINPMTRLGYAIYSDGGNKHMLGGPTGTLMTGVIQATALNFAVDTPNKAIAYGFGSAGQENFGKHQFYNGKSTVVVTIDNSGVEVAGTLKASEGIQATALNFIVDTLNKAIAYGFGSAGQENFGKHQFYNGKNTVVVTIDNTGLKVAGVVTPGSYTLDSLPSGVTGATAFCTNGRKVGEGVGAGTGVPVYYSNGEWRVYSTDAIVAI